MSIAGDQGSRVLAARVLTAWRWLVRTARLTIGLPDYDAYCCHMRKHHDANEPMSRDAFFRDRLQARYGRGRSRCC